MSDLKAKMHQVFYRLSPKPQYIYLVNGMLTLLTVEHVLISCIDFGIICQNFYTASSIQIQRPLP